MMPVAYIYSYIHTGKVVFNKAKKWINTRKIILKLPYGWICFKMLFRGDIKCLRYHEGLLHVWVCLLEFKTIFIFRILPISSLGFAPYVQNYACREERYNIQAKQLRKQSKGTRLESLLSLHSLERYVRIPWLPFSVSRRICMFLKLLSALSKCLHVQSTNSNRPSYLHPNVPDSVVLHLSDPGGTFHLALHLRLQNSEGSNQDVTLRNEALGSSYNREF